MNKILHFCSWLILVFLIASCKGQPKTGSPQDKDTQASSTVSEIDPYFTESEGISAPFGPRSIVRNVLQDKKGNIWLATWLGIIHYDGKTFTNFTNKEGLRRFRVFSLLEDRKGNIWFGTIGAGIYVYDGKSFTNLTREDGLVNDKVGTLYEDKAGNIWIGTMGGISIYNGKTFENYTEAIGLPNNDINSIIEDKDGKFWFGSRGEAFVHDPTTVSTLLVSGLKSFTKITKEEGTTFSNVRCIIADSKGDIWLGGSEGLWRFDGHSYHLITKSFVGYMYEDSKGNIWTSSLGKDREHWAFSRYDKKSLLDDTPIATQIKEDKGMFFGIEEDQEGSLWFGTLNGVYRYDGKGFNYFEDPEAKVE